MYEKLSGFAYLTTVGSIVKFESGFWTPGKGKTIQPFKYQQAGGYVELIRGIIGGEKNKKLYLSGWCQFISMAKR